MAETCKAGLETEGVLEGGPVVVDADELIEEGLLREFLLLGLLRFGGAGGECVRHRERRPIHGQPHLRL